jgi:hypothetical protein
MKSIKITKLQTQAVEAIKNSDNVDEIGNNPYVTIQLIGLLREINDLRGSQSDTFVLDHICHLIENKLKPPKTLDKMPLI